jgi:Flp pilus assembly protein TadG
MVMPARKLIRDERGMSLVFVGLGLMGFFAATMLAIDVGMLMTARAQAQNSADAGAHAGAVALAFEDYDDRTSTGPAVTHAVNEALANKVMGANVSVTPADVDFPPNPSLPGLTNRVRVRVYRDSAHENPLNTFIAKLFGTPTADISAVAVAEASPSDLPARCLPFTIPDRWDERTDPPFDADTSYFELFSGRHGNNPGTPLARPDVYVDADHEGYTGYDRDRDVGTLIKLKTDPGTTVSPSVYNPIVVPGEGTGADRYRNGIVNGVCPPGGWGSMLTLEPGGVEGPTQQGIEELVAKDQDAYFDTGCNCIKGSLYNPPSKSPRVAAIPLYDPDYYEHNQQTGRNVSFKVANYLGVFVLPMRGREVMAYIVPMPGNGQTGNGTPGAMFLTYVRIIQ